MKDIKDQYTEQVQKLSQAVDSNLKSFSIELGKKHYLAALPVLQWLDYLSKSEVTGCCDDMLKGLRASLVEASGCLCLGLVRPAIFALRGQIDAALAWLYYKDHPVEWRHVLATGYGFKQKGDVIEFLEAYLEKFSGRFAILAHSRTRKEIEPYRMLSAHIHSQSTLVMPTFTQFDAMVYPEKRCTEVVKMQTDVAEYISDVYVAYFGDKWASLPNQVVDSIKSRLPAEKQAKLFA